MIIGGAVIPKLVEKVAKVVLATRHENYLREIAEKVKAAEDKALIVKTDVTNRESV